MDIQPTTSLRITNWGSRFRVLLLAAMVLPLVAVSPARMSEAASRVQPVLLAIAQQAPDDMVGVIVQKSTADKSVENVVAGLGGTVTKDLHIINAFAARMPAKAVPQLANVAGVRWVSLDAPVDKSGTTSTTGQFTTWASELVASSTSSISSGFTSATIRAGSFLWFNSVVKVSGVGSTPVTVNFDNAEAEISMVGQVFKSPIPGAIITFSPSATTATSSYDAVVGKWRTTVPARLNGTDVFLSGASVRIPSDIPGSATSVVLSGRFTTDTAGVSVAGWQWAASTYSNFSNDYNALGVKPCDDGTASQYRNSDNAGTPENYKAYVVPGARGNGGTNYTGDYSPSASMTPAKLFAEAANMVDAGAGPNATYGYGTNAVQTFAGFLAEKSPNEKISKVEVALKAYVPARLSSVEDPKLSMTVGGVTVSNVTLQNTAFDTFVGAASAGMVYVNVTGTRAWTWGDFDNGLQMTLNQTGFASNHPVYYDAVGLRVTTIAGTDTTGGTMPVTQANNMVDSGKLLNVYNRAVRATDVWAGASGMQLQGQGIGVAVVDSGVVRTEDLKGRVIGAVNFDDDEHESGDSFGHGTFVAGLIAGDGKASNGQYVGMAPKSSIINVRVSGDDGVSTEADVIEALQWVYENKSRHNMRIVNLSLNSSMAQSYHTSPICAAVEVLWFNKVVVVVSAGNNGTANLFPPANDPFVITVGATDDKGTVALSDDTIAPFSAYGTTENGAVKPEIVAPGTKLIGFLPQNDETEIGRLHPEARVNDNYFRMSGTSMAAPVVAGAVALLLQDEPNLNPDQVKYRLMSTAAKSDRWAGYSGAKAGAGYLDILAAVTSTSTQAMNTGTRASQLLWTGSQPVNWSSVNWSSVNWSSVNWSSVNWSSVNWSSVNWSSDYWQP
jgi:serine protease AprX